jgi:hypothetical protein
LADTPLVFPSPIPAIRRIEEDKAFHKAYIPPVPGLPDTTNDDDALENTPGSFSPKTDSRRADAYPGRDQV